MCIKNGHFLNCVPCIKSINITLGERCVILIDQRKYATNLSHCVINYTAFMI